MFRLSKNKIITITRGDSAEFNLPLNIGTTVEPDYYEVQEGDKVYFGVTEPNKPFEFGLIRKVLGQEEVQGHQIVITLKPEDTEFIIPNTYYYSLKILTSENDVYTVFDKKKFIVVD